MRRSFSAVCSFEAINPPVSILRRLPGRRLSVSAFLCTGPDAPGFSFFLLQVAPGSLFPSSSYDMLRMSSCSFHALVRYIPGYPCSVLYTLLMISGSVPSFVPGSSLSTSSPVRCFFRPSQIPNQKLQSVSPSFYQTCQAVTASHQASRSAILSMDHIAARVICLCHAPAFGDHLKPWPFKMLRVSSSGFPSK